MKKNIIIRTGRGTKGSAEGEALVAPVRISFWGGFNPETGNIIESGNPLEGQNIKDKVLVFITSKGSSGTPSGLMAAKRTGNVPAAIINTELDSLAALGPILLNIPIVTDLEADPFELIETGDWVRVDADKRFIEIKKKI